MKKLARTAVFAFVSLASISAFAAGPGGGNPRPTGTGSLVDVIAAVLIAFTY